MIALSSLENKIKQMKNKILAFALVVMALPLMSKLIGFHYLLHQHFTKELIFTSIDGILLFLVSILPMVNSVLKI